MFLQFQFTVWHFPSLLSMGVPLLTKCTASYYQRTVVLAPNMIAKSILLAVHNSVCEITFEKWVDTLSGHDKVSMDMDRIVWT